MAEPQCVAHSTRTGERCKKQCIKGGTVCRTHGGSIGRVIAAADRRVTMEAARATGAALISRMPGEQVDADPLVNLVRMVTVAAMAERAYALLQAGSDILVPVSYGVQGTRMEPSPYLKLWNEERDRLAKIAKLALDAGVAERQLRMAEAEGQRIVELVLGVLDDLGLTGDQLERARVSAAKRLRVLAGGIAS